jgi:hypothetical protein
MEHTHPLPFSVPMPPKVAALPRNARGYPIPFFVAYVDGLPEFRLARASARGEALRFGLCWVCGQRLGAYVSHVVGPMCCVNRNSAEPPLHRECAEFSVQACPFLLKPAMERREDEFTRTHGVDPAGIMLKRNPGVTAVWTTRGTLTHGDGRGGILFNIGEPTSISLWREGRAATRAETEASITSGRPYLLALDPGDREAEVEIDRRIEGTLALLDRLVFTP